MVEDVKLILSKSVDEVISTSLTLTLLRCYSKLYIGGGQPRCCARSQKEYYRKLKLNGLTLAAMYDEAINKTHKLKIGGILHISHPKKGTFSINTELISDKMALEYLADGILEPQHFVKMPETFETPKPDNLPIVKEKQDVKKGRKKKGI